MTHAFNSRFSLPIRIGLVAVLFLGAHAAQAGDIKDRYDEINQMGDRLERIELKLDLILAEYIKDEKRGEDAAEVVDTTIEKTKEGLKKGASWVSEKAMKILDE